MSLSYGGYSTAGTTGANKFPIYMHGPGLIGAQRQIYKFTFF